MKLNAPLSLLALSLVASSMMACAATPASDDVSGAADLSSAASPAAVLQVDDGTISAGTADVVRLTPGQSVALVNVSAAPQALVLFDSNSFDNEPGHPFDYPKATKLTLAAGERIVLGSAGHALPREATFIGFDAPELAEAGLHDFAKATVWVGRKVTKSCNVTTATLGTDACPAWSVDADFCTCTPAFPGGG